MDPVREIGRHGGQEPCNEMSFLKTVEFRPDKRLFPTMPKMRWHDWQAYLVRAIRPRAKSPAASTVASSGGDASYGASMSRSALRRYMPSPAARKQPHMSALQRLRVNRKRISWKGSTLRAKNSRLFYFAESGWALFSAGVPGEAVGAAASGFFVCLEFSFRSSFSGCFFLAAALLFPVGGC